MLHYIRKGGGGDGGIKSRSEGGEEGTGTHGDFVLARQVGPFTQELALRQREHAGRVPDQHRVVQLGVSRG